MEARSREFAAEMQRRRSTRHFSDRPVARVVVEACPEAAGTAPSGAHLQPWHFVVVADPERKRRIREAAERAEAEFYASAPSDWLAALAPLLAALHHAGLVALTHTPNPMGLLNAILERPANERPVMLVVTGYPASGAQVPSLGRKTLREFVTFR
jgi:iodotyrosine deiodinase